MVMMLFLIVGLAVACAPSFVIGWLAWKYLPHRYTFTPSWITGVCMILAFLTGLILNPELEMGMLSLFFLMLLLMLGWTLVLLLIGITIKLYYENRDYNA